MSRSYLDIEGVYDKTKRYLVRNWSDDDFTQEFAAETGYNGDKVIETLPAYTVTIKAGDLRELGQFEAFLFTKHFVDREMYKAALKFTDRVERERAEMAVNNRDLRKPYEDKTIEEVGLTKSMTFIDELREQIRQEEASKLAGQGKPATVPSGSESKDDVKVEQSTTGTTTVGEFDWVKV